MSCCADARESRAPPAQARRSPAESASAPAPPYPIPWCIAWRIRGPRKDTMRGSTWSSTPGDRDAEQPIAAGDPAHVTGTHTATPPPQATSHSAPPGLTYDELPMMITTIQYKPHANFCFPSYGHARFYPIYIDQKNLSEFQSLVSQNLFQSILIHSKFI